MCRVQVVASACLSLLNLTQLWKFLNAPRGSTVAFFGLDLSISSTITGMREAPGGRQPVAAKSLCSSLFFLYGWTRRKVFHVGNCQHVNKKAAHVTLDLRFRHKINLCSTRFVSGKSNGCSWQSQKYQVDPWSRGREVVGGGLRSSSKPTKNGTFFAIGEGLRRLSSVFYSALNVFFHQMPGPHPPHITGRRVGTVTVGWVAAPNERASFRFHDEVVGCSLDVCRRLGIWPLRIKHFAACFSGRCCPNIQPIMFAFVLFSCSYIFEDSCS